jgi:Lrp/AsnC family leucine-responsive transcriptional regulator
MEEAGVIERYEAIINPAALERGILCIVQLQVNQAFDFNELVKQLLEFDEVVEIANVTGDFDAHIRVLTRDVTHLRDFLYNKLGQLPAHQSTNSSIVLNLWKKPLGIEID